MSSPSMLPFLALCNALFTLLRPYFSLMYLIYSCAVSVTLFDSMLCPYCLLSLPAYCLR